MSPPKTAASVAPKRGTAAAIDPVTLEVIRHGLISVANQIDANITRTAFSPYIYEYKDYAVGLVDPDGQLVAQNTGGMPIFVADSVGMAVRDGLALYGRARLHHGDVLVCNHASVQGQHLNNVVMYTPIFAGPARADLIGFFAINMHWIDVGGSVPRSTDIFMEGLQFRSIKMWSKGEPVEEIHRIIEDNTRFPSEMFGDIEAQLAGCLLGRDMVGELANRYGTDAYLRAVELMLDQSEAAARACIRAIPDGTYEAEAMLDGDGESDTPLAIKVRVIVAGDEVTIDYTGLPGQVAGCINAGYFGGGRTTARVAFKYLIAADEPANEGLFRPLTLILPPRTLLSADPTAPMGNYNRSFPTIIDAIIRAFENALPERVTGGHYGTFAVVRFSGRRVDGSLIDCIDGGFGGWGAGSTHDGSGPYRTMAHGDSHNIPIELQEEIYPFRIDEFSLRPDSGGPGAFRGGLGIRKVYRITERCNLRIDFDRRHCPPWGVCGGKAAPPGTVTVTRDGAPPQVLHKVKSHPLAPGDIVIVDVGGGGGYGAPTQRTRDALLRDIRMGYVSRAAAVHEYGATITDADIESADETAT